MAVVIFALVDVRYGIGLAADGSVQPWITAERF